MKLTREQLMQVQDALLEGFDGSGLRRLARVELQVDLDSIVSGDNLVERVFELVQWAERTDYIFALVDGAKSQNPTNKDIDALWRASQLWRNPPVVGQAAILTTQRLTGVQLEELQGALVSAYSSVDELRMMVRIQLSENLDTIASGQNLRVLVFNLITWAEQIGRIDDLIRGAYRQNSGNPTLQKLAQTWYGSTLISSVPNREISEYKSAASAAPAAIDVFLSYSRKDQAAMHVVRDSLREVGISVWTDEGLKPGTPSWRAAIEDAVAQAHAMVVLLSPDAKKSQWVDNEVGYAQTLDKSIFPVLVAGDTANSVPISLIRVQWVDGRKDLRGTIVQDLRPTLLDLLGKSQVPLAVAFEWVTIPASEFLMGSDGDSEHEMPLSVVYLPEYRIAKCPVTNAQYMRFVEATSHKPPRHWTNGQIPRGKENHPVVYIDWMDAQSFCVWAGVRLPSEEEWEKAARGTDGNTYPWGNDPPSKYLCNFAGNVRDTTPVSAYPRGASPYGVLDMAGNVFEWTSTPSGGDASARAGGDQEVSLNSDLRILRGGNHTSRAYKIRCAYREPRNPDHELDYIGFRVVAL